MSDNELSVFGVPPEAEEIYRHFLRNPDTSAEEIHVLLRTDRETIADGIARALREGLLQPAGNGTGRYTATDPEAAVSRLMDVRLRELHEELQRVTHARPVIDGLRAEQCGGGETVHGIEQLVDIRQIRSRIADLAFFARAEILSVEPYAALRPESIRHARPLDLRCLQRRVRIRSVVLRRALEDETTREYLYELSEHGAEIRVADDVSERLLVYDRRTALVPLDARDPSRGALLARAGALVHNVVALFEKIWEHAADLDDCAHEPPPDPAAGLTETEREVLVSMCTVGKDEAGARELGISVRTYRRHVADLLRRLGAASRAQAALQARERGWI